MIRKIGAKLSSKPRAKPLSFSCRAKESEASDAPPSPRSFLTPRMRYPHGCRACWEPYRPGWFVLPRRKERIMATKTLSLLLVALLTCAAQPALTQGGGGGGGGAAAGGAGGGAAAGSAGGGAASSGNTGNAGGQAGPPSATSGNNAGSQARVPRSGDAGSQVGDNERFDQSVPPAASAYKRGIEASKNAPSAAPQGVFPSRNQAVPPPNARPNSGAGTTPNARTSSGTGTAPNGRPIGSVGSGPGSPEQPH